MLNRLEALGLITRLRSATDERTMQLTGINAAALAAGVLDAELD